MTSTVRDTPLRAVHERLGATMVTFAGWLMPVRYGSETAEHQAVRGAAGLFDLSHMGEILVSGAGAGEALDFALVGHLSALAPGRARYTMLCAADGGILDDLIVYRRWPAVLVVANAANTATVAAALAERATGHGAQCRDATSDYALIAIQGPNATGILARLTPAPLADLKYYAGWGTVAGSPCCSPAPATPARTASSCSPGRATRADWVALSAAAPTRPRRRAGRPRYAPAGGGHAVVRQRARSAGHTVRRRPGAGGGVGKPGDFVGRAALAERAQSPPPRVLAGLVAALAGCPGTGTWHLGGRASGGVTSGAPSPTLGGPIAMAYLARRAARPRAAHRGRPGTTEPAR